MDLRRQQVRGRSRPRSLDPLVALRLHAVDAVVIHELLEVVQVVPPLEEEGLGDEAEPRRDQELAALGLLQHLLQLLLAHVAVALDLVGVRAQLHVLLRERRRTKMLRVKMSFCLYVCVRDGRRGLQVLARSFLAFVAMTIKVTIKKLNNSTPCFEIFFF